MQETLAAAHAGRPLAFLGALMGFSAVLCWLRFDSLQVGSFQDDAHYLVLAKSIASGQGHRLISYPDAPVEPAFPPGWPLLLSPLVALFPDNYILPKLLSLAFLLASLSLVYFLLAGRLRSPYRETLTALTALNPALIGASGMLMSEAAYLFFSLLALALFECGRGRVPQERWGLLVVVACLALYSQWIRTVGLALVGSLPLYLLLKRRVPALAAVAGVTAVGLAGQYWFNARHGGSLVSRGYEAQVFHSTAAQKLGQVWTNLEAYAISILADVLFPVFGPRAQAALERSGFGSVLPLLSLLIVALVVLGWALSLRRFRWSDLYVPLYFAAVLAFWNPSVGSAQARFLIPLVPFLYFYLLTAVAALVERIARPNPVRIDRFALAAAVPLVLLLVARNVQDWRSPARDRIPDLAAGADWIRTNTPPDTVVMAREPVSRFLYTRRKMVDFPAATQDLRERVAQTGAAYILLTPALEMGASRRLDAYTQAHVLPRLAAHPDEFRLVFVDAEQGVRIYRCEMSATVASRAE